MKYYPLDKASHYNCHATIQWIQKLRKSLLVATTTMLLHLGLQMLKWNTTRDKNKPKQVSDDPKRFQRKLLQNFKILIKKQNFLLTD